MVSNSGFVHTGSTRGLPRLHAAQVRIARVLVSSITFPFRWEKKLNMRIITAEERSPDFVQV